MTWRLTSTDVDWKHEQKNERYIDVKAALTPAGADYTKYVPDEQILQAVNTALSLGKPLLVAGDPGVGKTMLAKYVAARLGLFNGEEPEVLRYDVRSTTKGSDLIYRYDAIRHFRESKGEVSAADAHGYIGLEALGQGIALATHVKFERLDDNSDEVASCSDEIGVSATIDGEKVSDGLAAVLHRFLVGKSYPRLSVVLIDEIDKAPRDVPNDLLRAIEEMVFKIDELGPSAVLGSEKLQGDQARRRPLVIITTNEERTLPPAFLRRCCFLHLEFPNTKRLKDIVESQLNDRWREATIASDAIALLEALRTGDNSFSRSTKPGTAELLDFLYEVRARLADADGDKLKALGSVKSSEGEEALVSAARNLRLKDDDVLKAVDPEELAVTVFAKTDAEKEKVKKAFAALT